MEYVEDEFELLRRINNNEPLHAIGSKFYLVTMGKKAAAVPSPLVRDAERKSFIVQPDPHLPFVITAEGIERFMRLKNKERTNNYATLPHPAATPENSGAARSRKRQAAKRAKADRDNNKRGAHRQRKREIQKRKPRIR